MADKHLSQKISGIGGARHVKQEQAGTLLAVIDEGVAQHIDVARLLQQDEMLKDAVGKLADALVDSYCKGGKLIIMGNGGSAADAQHAAAEMLGKYMKERKAMPAIALTANSSAMSAIGNDYGYEKVFVRQLEGWMGKNDVVVGISTSGNSPNVVAALEYAKKEGVFTAAFVGAKKCSMDSLADALVKVPSESTPRIQEMHIMLLHIVCGIVEDALVERGIA
ncbi:SIS domain-containing protein [Candidatus Micrarchaeota archaeon]|nr:SIS domain-containing protein [Candidatus Micrarchaeota archaeon]